MINKKAENLGVKSIKGKKKKSKTKTPCAMLVSNEKLREKYNWKT